MLEFLLEKFGFYVLHYQEHAFVCLLMFIITRNYENNSKESYLIGGSV